MFKTSDFPENQNWVYHKQLIFQYNKVTIGIVQKYIYKINIIKPTKKTFTDNKNQTADMSMNENDKAHLYF